MGRWDDGLAGSRGGWVMGDGVTGWQGDRVAGSWGVWVMGWWGRSLAGWQMGRPAPGTTLSVQNLVLSPQGAAGPVSRLSQPQAPSWRTFPLPSGRWLDMPVEACSRHVSGSASKPSPGSVWTLCPSLPPAFLFPQSPYCGFLSLKTQNNRRQCLRRVTSSDVLSPSGGELSHFRTEPGFPRHRLAAGTPPCTAVPFARRPVR